MSDLNFKIIRVFFAMVPMLIAFLMSVWDVKLMFIIIFCMWGNNIGNMTKEEALK